MAKVFVTGGTGFIGYHLIKALSEQGHEILCLARKTSRIEPLRQFAVKFIHGDIQDADSIAGTLSNVQVVFHLAGTTKALRREDFFRVNELGVENLLKACRQSKATPVVVFVSSLSAAGPVMGRNGVPKQEGAPSNPVSLYGISKRAGELVAERYARDLPITIVRPGIVFGEWDKDCLEMFRPIEKTGIHLVPGYRQKRYSLVYAGDLVNLLISAATKGERLPPNSDGAPLVRGTISRPAMRHHRMHNSESSSARPLGDEPSSSRWRHLLSGPWPSLARLSAKSADVRWCFTGTRPERRWPDHGFVLQVRHAINWDSRQHFH